MRLLDALRYLAAHQARSGSSFQLGDHEQAQSEARRAVDSSPGLSVRYTYLVPRSCAEDSSTKRERHSSDARDVDFCVLRFRVTVGVGDAVFDNFAQACREAGRPE